MAVYDNSRYLYSPPYSRLASDYPMLKSRQRFQFNQDNFTTYQWCIGDTLDGVAYKIYGLCALRWVLLDANPKYRTEYDIHVGDIINVPDYEEVVNLVNV